MSILQSTGKTFNLGALIVEQVTSEPCLRASQYMKEQPITCACSVCQIDNKGMTNAEITVRMDKAYQS